MIRAGIIGLGVGAQHIAGFLAHGGVEIAALCDREPEREAWARATYPAARFYRTADDLIDDPDIDIVSIASFDGDHAAQVSRALGRAKHVFVEKPLCRTEAELAAIEALWRQSGRRLSSNLILRASPRFRDLKARIEAGDMGRIYYLEGDYDYGRLEKLTEGWRGAEPDYSPTFGGGIHLVDLILWLTGRRVVEVNALGNRIGSGGRLGFDDLVAASLRLDDGTIAKVTSNFACMRPHFHKVSVYGTEATFENDPGPARLWRSRDPAVPAELLATEYPGTPKGAMIPAFVDAILGRGEPMVTEAEVFATIRVCRAIDAALATGETVRVG